MRLIDADRFAEISKHHIPEVLEDTFDEGYVACLKVVDLTPTVQAIPIEWIVNKWAKKFWKVINGKKYYTGDGYDTIWDMIEDWEKENGK